MSFAVEPGAVPAGLVAGQRVAVVTGSGAADGAAAAGGTDYKDSPLVGVVTDVAATEGESVPTVVTLLVDTGAARRAALIDKPRLVVLSPVGREVP